MRYHRDREAMRHEQSHMSVTVNYPDYYPEKRIDLKSQNSNIVPLSYFYLVFMLRKRRPCTCKAAVLEKYSVRFGRRLEVYIKNTFVVYVHIFFFSRT